VREEDIYQTEVLSKGLEYLGRLGRTLFDLVKEAGKKGTRVISAKSPTWGENRSITREAGGW